MITMFLLAMMTASISATAQEITITLLPGWTWIGFTKAETMDISTAFGSFVPMEGDIIKSQYGFAVYENGQWSGNLQQLIPGLGYHYYSMRGEPVSFVYADSTPHAQVLVTTSEPMLITGNSAMGGGNVASNDGTYILVKGICWATHETPTSNDNYLEEGSGEGSFSATMIGLNWSTTYYYRAYAVTPSGTVYGEQQSFTTRDGIPTLTTDSITSITAISATSGGNITDDGGLNVSARGVCWSTSPNPTVSDSHTTNGTGTGGFTSNITGLEIGTTYYVRAYATTNAGIGYGDEKVFTTGNGGGDHAYVDLGLPSGLLWATCNVGANAPEDYGDYFAWGETESKDTYKWNTYQYGTGGNYEYYYYMRFTKYCTDSNYGYNGFTDNLTTLLPEDDAATANWGSGWRMPTQAEFQELLDNTTMTRTQQNGVDGRLFTAANGNSLFLPTAGYRYSSSLIYARSYHRYWSSSLNTDYPYSAWHFCGDPGYYGMESCDRYFGFPVRPVRSARQN